MKYFLILIIVTQLFSQTIHSSLSTYYEDKSFKNSKQKEDGVAYGFGADIHHKSSEYRFAYERGDTNTKQPPLKDDLKTDKLFLKYAYAFNDAFEVNVNYINILSDNIAITDGGKSYGVGASYNFNKKLSFNFTQFFTDYKDFNVNQSDLKVEFKTKLDKMRVKLTSLTHYINIDEQNINTFTKNSQSDYLTSGLKLHVHYNIYHFGAGAYLGKRAFAIMDEGFKIQHHAMEFDRTYAIGAGVDIYDFVLRLQYVYQKATELPSKNKDVEVSNTRVMLNYKF